MFAVRQRYYLTKSGALRLRYTLPVVAFALCLLSAFSHPNLPSLSLPSLSVASLQEVFIQTPALPKTLDIAEKTIEMPRLNSKAVERSVQVLNAPQASGIQKAAFAIQKASEPLKITKKIQAGGTLAGALKEAGLKDMKPIMRYKRLRNISIPNKFAQDKRLPLNLTRITTPSQIRNIAVSSVYP